MTQRIAIIGAGIAGLACARALADAGLAPVVLDKSRGVGGRLATRRADGGLQFDHGAPYVTATDPHFAALLAEAEADGAVARWDGPLRPGDAGAPAFVGLPGMSGLARFLARGLDVRTGMAVSALSASGAGWGVTIDDQTLSFDRVVLTLPAPQILRLLDPGHPFAAALSAVVMSPCLTLMAAFPGDGGPRTVVDLAAPFGDLDWIAQDSAKPGRDPRRHAWVAQATVDFSRRHLELDMPEIAQRMLPILCARLGRDPSEALHCVAHRWRFARTERALGRPCLSDPAGRLHVGGDWCLGPLAEHGWASGRAIARDILRG